jgi:hypothetical protein
MNIITDGNSSHFSTLRTRTEMVLETLVFSPFDHLTRLVARENFIILSRRESSRSYIMNIVAILTFQFKIPIRGCVENTRFHDPYKFQCRGALNSVAMGTRTTMSRLVYNRIIFKLLVACRSSFVSVGVESVKHTSRMPQTCVFGRVCMWDSIWLYNVACTVIGAKRAIGLAFLDIPYFYIVLFSSHKFLFNISIFNGNIPIKYKGSGEIFDQHHRQQSFLTGWSSLSWSRNFLHLTENEGSLPCLQAPATGSCTELDESNPHHHTLYI